MLSAEKLRLLSSLASRSAIQNLAVISLSQMVEQGDRLLKKRDLAAAEQYYRQALKIDSTCSRAHAGMGAVFLLYGDFNRAEDCYRHVAAVNPGDVEAYCNLGNALFFQGRYDEGFNYINTALAINPDYADAHVRLAVAHLSRANFREGWQEYEWRLKKESRLSGSCCAPVWQGEVLDHKQIVLTAEGGLGDTIQFVRYVPMVAARGGHVTLQVQSELRRLLARTEGVQRIMGPEEIRHDVHYRCPLLSLPLRFQTELGTIPRRVPYLTLEPADIQRWSRRINTPRLKIGLAWAGQPKQVRDRHRSISLNILEPLLRIPGVSFFSLQRGDAAMQIHYLSPGLTLCELESQCSDFAESAALLSLLDLVISVDTSIAHLAGALAKPVWILLPHVADWRWLLTGESTPWYPTARLFRQPSSGDWQAVITKVETELRNLLASGTSYAGD